MNARETQRKAFSLRYFIGGIAFLLFYLIFWRSVGYGLGSFNRNMHTTRETSSFCLELLVSHTQFHDLLWFPQKTSSLSNIAVILSHEYRGFTQFLPFYVVRFYSNRINSMLFSYYIQLLHQRFAILKLTLYQPVELLSSSIKFNCVIEIRPPHPTLPLFEKFA